MFEKKKQWKQCSENCSANRMRHWHKLKTNTCRIVQNAGNFKTSDYKSTQESGIDVVPGINV